MKGQIGTKHYDTDTAELLQALPNGFYVYRKRGGSNGSCFLYNPRGQTAKECFFPLSPEDSARYLKKPDEAERSKSGTKIEFQKYDRDRIKRLALLEGKSMTQFILMLVDRYEQEQNDRAN